MIMFQNKRCASCISPVDIFNRLQCTYTYVMQHTAQWYYQPALMPLSSNVYYIGCLPIKDTCVFSESISSWSILDLQMVKTGRAEKICGPEPCTRRWRRVLSRIHLLQYWSTTSGSIPHETSTRNSPVSNFSLRSIMF